jgi:hypothetical protein
MIEFLKTKLGFVISFIEYLILALFLLKVTAFQTLRDYKVYSFTPESDFYAFLFMIEFIVFIFMMVFFMIISIIKSNLNQNNKKTNTKLIWIIICSAIGMWIFLINISSWSIFSIKPLLIYLIFTTYLFFDVFIRFINNSVSIKSFIFEKTGFVVTILILMFPVMLMTYNDLAMNQAKVGVYFIVPVSGMVYYGLRVSGLVDRFFLDKVNKLEKVSKNQQCTDNIHMR